MNKEDIIFAILIPMTIAVFMVCVTGAPFLAAIIISYLVENNYWSRETTINLRSLNKDSVTPKYSQMNRSNL